MTLEEATKQAYEARDDLKAAEARAVAARAAKQAAAASALPSVHVDADYGALGPSASDTRGTYGVAASVHDPAAAVPALQVPVPKSRAERRQPRDHFRCLGHQRGHGRRIAQPGTRRQCVLGVQRDRIIRVEHRRHAALGEGGGPAAELVLRKKQHPPAARRRRRCSGN
jgi:hypothetical protein